MKYKGTLESATPAGKGMRVKIKTDRGTWQLSAYRDAAQRVKGLSVGSFVQFDATRQSGDNGDWWRMDAIQSAGGGSSGGGEALPQGHEKRLFIQNCLVSVLARPEAKPDDVYSFGGYLADFYDTKILGKTLNRNLDDPGPEPEDYGDHGFDPDGPPY